VRKYDGPKLHHGKVHYPGKSGHLNQATSPSPPTLTKGVVSDPKGNFAGSINPGAKLPAKASTPTANMLPQNVGKGPAPAPTPRAPQPKHSAMQPEGQNAAAKKTQLGPDLMVKPDPNSPVNRKKAQIAREHAQEAKATQAQALQQRAQDKQQAPRAPGGPPAPPPSAQGPAANLGPGQSLGNVRRGFGRDATGNPFKASR
jgi:hypothetical protein